MHERDLRRQALESGKTVSRKQKAKLLSARSSATNSPFASPGVSPAGSRAASRNPSRQVSEDEDDDSDELASSVASLDLGTGSFAQFDSAPEEVWQHELREISEQIIERSRNKRNTGEAREEIMAIYTNILRAQYAAEEVGADLAELVPALLKSVKAGSGEREAVFALRALAMTILTTGEEIYDEVHQALRNRIQDDSSPAAQEAAIHALGVAAYFGGAGIEGTDDTMDYFLDIIETDGEHIGATDNGPVVAAALQEWGFLATQFGDLEGKTGRPLECFENQLESTDLHVLQAAGENIALLYEQSYKRSTEDDESKDKSSAEDEFEVGDFRRVHWKKAYDVYPGNEFGLKSSLADLARSSARHLGKEKRKELHKTFSDVLHTVEHPWRGPRFSTALDENMTAYMGHRLSVRYGRDGVMTVNRWWKLHRYEAIKRVVGPGFLTHYTLNQTVREALSLGLNSGAQF
ncbi:putative phosphatidate cytidylyltransferase [Venturia nashicola]|nr:putative phosphatidate cytidylyltransferase [Venturia nashicola]